jgi:hypothetical protein
MMDCNHPVSMGVADGELIMKKLLTQLIPMPQISFDKCFLSESRGDYFLLFFL